MGAWYPSLGQTGARVIDVSGRGNDSAFNGSPTWVINSYGHALRFNNADSPSDSLAIPAGMNSQGVSEWSLTVLVDLFASSVETRLFWHEQAGGSVQNYINYDAATAEWDWLTRDTSTGLTGSRNNDLTVSALNADPASGQLVTFVYSVSRSLKAIYTNGVLLGSTSTSIDPFNGSWTEEIGLVFSNHYGTASLLMRHNRALFPNESQTLYQDPFALVRQRAMWLPSAGAVTPPTGNRRRRLLIGA